MTKDPETSPVPSVEAFAAFPRLEFEMLEQLQQMATLRGSDLLERLLVIFRNQSHEVLTTLGEALRAQDAQSVAERAHGLKGSARSMGARRLAEIASSIERSALRGDLDAVEPLLTLLAAEHSASEDAFEAWIRRRTES
ncbi:MAG: Hpt domain-containing protein [Acidobacteriota bacterium]